jgi:hypothetical protein
MEIQPEGIPASQIFFDQSAVQHWLSTQPILVSTVMASRAGLRALPLIVELWGRPGFSALQFFRAAHAAWTFTREPGVRTKDAARAARAKLTENSHAGAAVMLATAACVPRGSNNIAEFAARALASAAYADSSLANASLDELAAVENGGDGPARISIAIKLTSWPLWPGATPHRISSAWEDLKQRLWSASDADWEFWIEWYEDLLAGRPSGLDKAFDVALATLPNELWEQGPKVVNARIKELINAYTAVPLPPAESLP